MNELGLYFLPTLEAYEIKTEEIDGVNHLIVPVVMMVEGVHNGSQGPILHYTEDLAESAPKWAGLPVTISHPEIDGKYVLASDERVIETYHVGFIRQAYMDGDKLKAEICVNEQRLIAVSPQTLTMLNERKTIEVSLGMLADRVEQQGIWNNEVYKAISKNYQPDHLALLPEEIGACSIGDGCGIRVNVKGGNDVNLDFAGFKQGFYAADLVNNKDGFQETVEKAWNLLNSMDNENKSYYLVDVYDDHLVYRVRNKADDSVLMFKQNYTVGEDGAMDLTDGPVKVRRDVSYITVNKESKKEVINKNENSMCVKCKERATELITNSRTHFTEEDRDWLENLSEDQLDKLIPMRSRPTPPTVEQAWEVIQNNAKSLKDYLDNMPEEYALQVNKGIEVYTKERESMVQLILDNTEEGTWTKEDLSSMKLEVLTKLSKSVVKEEKEVDTTVYPGAGAKPELNKGGKIEPLMIPEVEFKTEK